MQRFVKRLQKTFKDPITAYPLLFASGSARMNISSIHSEGPGAVQGWVKLSEIVRTAWLPIRYRTGDVLALIQSRVDDNWSRQRRQAMGVTTVRERVAVMGGSAPVLALMLLTALAMALAGANPIQAQATEHVVINEFMASNGQTVADEDGDFEDWIELFNPGTKPISLAGYGLSDDPNNPFRWVFPDIGLAPDGYLLIWASGKDRAVPGEPLHTNFSISASGEPLLLTHPADALLDQVGSVAVPRDISYGRQPDGASVWYFFDQPTPGSSNNASPAYAEILDPPVFSHRAGFYTESFSLTLSSTSLGVEIIFTLDGSIPDPDNLDGRTYTFKNQYPQFPGDPFGEFLTDSYRTYSYSQPLAIVNRSTVPDKLTGKSSTYDRSPSYFPEEPVFKGTVVRARAIRDGALPSPIQTHTFFVTPEGRDRYSLPIVTLSMQEDAFFDYDDGIYTAGVDFDAWRAANPDDPARGVSPANWHRHGDDAEFGAHIELFETDSPEVAFSQDLGFRIHGGAVRSLRVKSLRLYARSDYGPSDFAYAIFPDQPYDSYRRLILRNSGQDFRRTMFRDAAIQSIVAHLNFDTQAYRPAIVFINGEYWGIHNIRERYDQYYLERVYAIDPDNIDLLENNARAVEGDALHYNAMLGYIRANGLAEQVHYDYVRTQMDVVNFADYQIAQIFARNTDWPGNNLEYWRLRTDGYQPDAPYGHDGRWRWLLFDTDFGFGLEGGSAAFEHNTLAFATQPGGTAYPNPDWSTFLLRELLTNQEFRRSFITRFADLMNTIFLPDHMASIIVELQQNIEAEMPEQITRWRLPSSISAWYNEVAVMINFAYQRPYYLRQHIRDQFGIPGDFTLTVDVAHPRNGYVRINSIDLLASTPGVADTPYPWTGIYFQGIPVEIEAVAYPGYRFAGWEGLPDGTPALTVQVFTEDAVITAFFEEAPQQEPVLLHYWHFNNLPSGILTEVPADHTVLTAATITYPGAGVGYMDRVNDEGTVLNARMDEPAGRALRVRNPSDTRELHLTLPTTGYQDIVLRYAATRTTNGAQGQALFYRTAQTADWVQFGAASTVTLDYDLFEYDFRAIAAVNDNPEFAVRILFGGSNAGGSSGNNRFDNITVEGVVASQPPPLAVTLGSLEASAEAMSPPYRQPSWPALLSVLAMLALGILGAIVKPTALALVSGVKHEAGLSWEATIREEQDLRVRQFDTLTHVAKCVQSDRQVDL